MEVSFRSIGIGNRVSGLSFGISWYITRRCRVRVEAEYKEGVQRGCIAEAAVAARRWKRILYDRLDSKEPVTPGRTLPQHPPYRFSISLSLLRSIPSSPSPLFFCTSFIGTPGIIRSVCIQSAMRSTACWRIIDQTGD